MLRLEQKLTKGTKMKTGELENAKRRAANLFDKWNNVTGFVAPHTSYYYEMLAVLNDAVHCGAQAALGVHEILDAEKDDATTVVRVP